MNDRELRIVFLSFFALILCITFCASNAMSETVAAEHYAANQSGFTQE